jgi:hypothetical protein
VAERGPIDEPFATVTLAQILLGQDLLDEARQMIEQLERRRPDDPRVAALAARARRRLEQGEIEQRSAASEGRDRIALALAEGALEISWELTDAGAALGRRIVRYSGHEVVRLFTALAGPRGVRRHSRDIELDHRAGRLELFGVPRGGVFVAALGFRGLNGVFVPLATSVLLVDEP